MNSFGQTGGHSHRRALSDIDVEMIAISRTREEPGYYDPADGSVYLVFDGHVLGDDDEADPDDEDWVRIDLEDSRDEYRDMADFAASVGDRQLADRLTRALSGTRVFRRFHEVLRSQSDAVTDRWHEFADARAEARAINWLVDNDLCDSSEAAAAIAQRDSTAERALENVAGARRSRDTD